MTATFILSVLLIFIVAIAFTIITMEIFHTDSRWIWHISSIIYFLLIYLIFFS